MKLSRDEIKKATQGSWLSEEFIWDADLHNVCTDTRTLQKADLFIALKGEKYDGHNFLNEAFEKGVRALVVNESHAVPANLKKKIDILVVQDTLQAYGDLAAFYRKKFKIPAVAITGSSGKTTVKELTAHILSKKFEVLKNKGTENNLVGVPKTLFSLEEKHQVMVIEMGTSLPGEINRLSSIIKPQIGIVTQIGLAHLEGLKDQAGIRVEKLSLLKHLERGNSLILNGDDPQLMDIKSGTLNVFRVGFDKEKNDLAAEQPWCHEKGSSFTVDGEIFDIQLFGRHNVHDALFAILTAKQLGMDISEIKKALADFSPVPGRMNLKKIADILFIDDSYNSNPLSFKAALETLKDFKTREKKGVVCGDMLELGKASEQHHRSLGKLMAELLFDFVIACGSQSAYLVDEAVKNGFDSKRIYHVKDSMEAGKLCKELAHAQDMILVKGSRGMKMENVFGFF